MRLRHEITGLALATAGMFVLVSVRSTSGYLLYTLSLMVRFVVGSVGAHAIAFGLIACGAVVMLRRESTGLHTGKSRAGLILLLLAVLGCTQLPTAGQGVIGRIFTDQAGGLIGVLLVEAMRPIIGPILLPIILALVAFSGLAMVTETPPTYLVVGGARFAAAAARVLWAVVARLRGRRIPVKPGRARRPATIPSILSKPLPGEGKPAPVRIPPAPRPMEAKPASAEAAKQAARQLSLGETGEQEVMRELPPLSLLADIDDARQPDDVADNVEVLEETLRSFGIDARVVEIERGPRVTRYEVQPPPGVRVARITNLADDLALALAALDVRVEAPVPGKGVIGIEVPNRDVVHVGLKGILAAELMQQNPSKLAFALGKDISGHPRVADLAKMPHLLIAGATNSGKSVCLNAMIVTILFRSHPDEVKFLMVDPKRVELSLFAGIPHLVAPVAHDARETAGLLRWAMREMEMRYGLFADRGVRNIQAYNEQAEIEGGKPLYYMVIVIDELADLMMQAAAEFESSICRLAQLARATGIHLVLATQRPSVNVITGTIKANIASRVAFAVASQADSRVILDVNGAERLVGSGDMLFLPFDASKPTRIQGAYVSEAEIEAVVDYWKKQGEPQYMAEVLAVDAKGAASDDEQIDDEMFGKALDFVLSTNYASASMLQRKLRIGYTRAARMIDMMEERGYIGPADGSRPREVYVTPRSPGEPV